MNRPTPLPDAAIATMRAHREGCQDGFWIGAFATCAYYVLVEIGVATLLALLPIIVASWCVHGRGTR